ncbi:hypothetical protein N7532_010989 [Penicillium argentinense]|uniref:Uncharacterized protein n=1 Tax=Penicillium argentinense TaxID=1131581 RepID=A0A9W9JYF9_9EURO|nr:uncharacterized protein N7532_010989 [Penicillium argentinense]KAJ5086218.1 hypothetical protein N7532_010989 [Penicillium argentinense]
MTVVDAVDALKAHTELIDIPVEPEEEGGGRERVEGLQLGWRLRQPRLLEVAFAELLVDRMEELKGDTMLFTKAKDFEI